MQVKKEIKKFGNSAVLVLTRENLEIYKIKVGDLVDVTITKSKKQRNV